ncbi:MAG: InlB B-repeat-containing protein [Candidatus Bathyarchaeia archaeon]|jgi:uncharacterized repeat protein (TIGR02543 family)
MKANMFKMLVMSVLVSSLLFGVLLQPASIQVKGQYPVPYRLTVQVNNSIAGTTTPRPGVTYVDYGLSIQVTANPNPGYVFKGWYLNGIYQHELTSITITMLHDNTLMAAFSQEAVSLSITTNPPQGGITNPPAGTLFYQYGSSIEVTAQTNPDYVFNGWYLDGVFMGTQTSITVAMSGNRELGAYFGGVTPIPETPPVQLPPAVLSVSCESFTTYSDFNIKINGALTGNGVGLPLSGVLIYLSVNGGHSWDILSYVNTDANGKFSVAWKPSVTGEFLLNATWSGNSEFSAASDVVNFAVTPFEEQSVFSVTSNSTISGLQFDSTTNELGFSVSGPSGTSGYTVVIIPKSLVSDISTIAVTMDGNPMDFDYSSQSDAWKIVFNYQHSNHQVVLNLDSEPVDVGPEPETENGNETGGGGFLPDIPLSYAIIIVGVLLAVTVIVVFAVMRKREPKQQQ